MMPYHTVMPPRRDLAKEFARWVRRLSSSPQRKAKATRIAKQQQRRRATSAKAVNAQSRAYAASSPPASDGACF